MDELSSAHREMLEQDSAISRDLIAQRGYRTVTDSNVLLRLGYFKAQAGVPGLLIPIWGPHGSEPVTYQYRPDQPRQKDGKVVKYESLPKQETRLDVPLAVRPKLGNPSEVLWITEGCKKADAAASKGMACVALPGVWNFRCKNERGGSVVLGDFEHLALKDREVVICFDSDAQEKPQVAQARRRLRDLLRSRGALVRYCALPATTGHKVGLDDFFAAGGAAGELQSYLRDDLGLVRATKLSDIEAQQVEWLWNPYLPAGELTLLAGDGGVGKSYLAMAICAAVTLGQALPGGDPRPPQDVLFVTDEDDVTRTVKPRGKLLGLDQSRFHVLDLADLDESPWLETVRENAIQHNVAIIVIDPLQSFLETGRDLNKTSDVRPLIRKLRELAQDTGATVLVVTHINKMTGGKAHYRVNGSVDIINGSRSALMAGRVDYEGEEIQVLGHAKSNYSARGPSLRYCVGAHGFEWLGLAQVGVEDISLGRKTVTKIDEAADFLRDSLAGGALLQRHVEESGTLSGHSRATLLRAKARLGIKSEKRQEGWVWHLPDQDAQEVLYGDLEHLGTPQVQNALAPLPEEPEFEHLERDGLLLGVQKVQTDHGGGLIL